MKKVLILLLLFFVSPVSGQEIGGVKLPFSNNLQGVVSGLDFKKVLFAIRLGNKPVDDDLKEGMLGQ